MLNGRYYLEREVEGEIEGYEVILNASAAHKTHYVFPVGRGDKTHRPSKKIARTEGVRLIRTLKSAGFKG